MDKVQTGQQLTIKATTWNSFIDAAEYVKNLQSNQAGSTISSGIHNGIVLVQNGEKNTIPQSSALVLVDLLSVPSNKHKNKYTMPVFLGKIATEETQQMPYGITLSPIAPGKIGRIMLLGVIPAMVNIGSSADMYAQPIPDDPQGSLQSSQIGVARILWKNGDYGSQHCFLQLGGSGEGGAAEDRYNGYFTIKDASTYTINDNGNISANFAIRVVDGNTYHKTDTHPYWESGDSIAIFDRTTVAVPSREFSNINLDEEMYVWLRPVTRYSAELEVGTIEEVNIFASVLLGKLTAVNGRLKIEQIWENGIIENPHGMFFNSFTICPLFESHKLIGAQVVNNHRSRTEENIRVNKAYVTVYSRGSLDNPNGEYLYLTLDVPFFQTALPAESKLLVLVVTIDYSNIPNSKAELKLFNDTRELPEQWDIFYEIIGRISSRSVSQINTGNPSGIYFSTVEKLEGFAINDRTSGENVKVEVNPGVLELGNFQVNVPGKIFSIPDDKKHHAIEIMYEVDLISNTAKAELMMTPFDVPETAQTISFGSVSRSYNRAYIYQSDYSPIRGVWYVPCGGIPEQ